MPNVYLSINTTQFNINKHNFNYTYHHLFNVIRNSFIKMYSLVSEIDYQFVCHVASTKIIYYALYLRRSSSDE